MHGKKQETNGLYVQLQGAFLPSSCFSVLLPKHITRPEFQVHHSHHNVLTRTFRLLYLCVCVLPYAAWKGTKPAEGSLFRKQGSLKHGKEEAIDSSRVTLTSHYTPTDILAPSKQVLKYHVPSALCLQPFYFPLPGFCQTSKNSLSSTNSFELILTIRVAHVHPFCFSLPSIPHSQRLVTAWTWRTHSHHFKRARPHRYFYWHLR